METKFVFKCILFCFSILVLTSSVQSRFITNTISYSSDGVHEDDDSFGGLSFLRFKLDDSESCKLFHGFLPCSTTLLSNIFLLLLYGFMMFLATHNLSTGTELLHEIFGPGVVGGLLPMIGAIPICFIILASVLSGSKETTQSKVLVGMDIFAGSVTLLITSLWGSCVFVAKSDIDGSAIHHSKDTKTFSCTGSGTSVDTWTTYGARIMLISVLPFIILLLPEIFRTSSGRRWVVLFSLAIAIALLVSYCIYQIVQPWIQKRKLEFVKYKHLMSGVLRHMEDHALGKLIQDDGEPDEDAIRELFTAADKNLDQRLSIDELRELIIEIQFEAEIDFDLEDVVHKLMSDLDVNNDLYISEEEFITGISNWLNEAKQAIQSASDHNARMKTNQEDQSGNWVTIKAASLVLVGVVIAAVFADPVVNTVNDFSTLTSIPCYFLSFIVLPLVMNSAGARSALVLASKKMERASSLTFSEIYASVTIHNLLCIVVFLAVVYARDLTWDFSAEFLIIVIVFIVIGLIASVQTVYPLWTCLVAFALYPFSLAVVYVLEYVIGWA